MRPTSNWPLASDGEASAAPSADLRGFISFLGSETVNNQFLCRAVYGQT